jgi:Domain of unknown function (DUF6456)
MPKRPAVERRKKQQAKREDIRQRQAIARQAWQTAEDIRLERIAEDQAPAIQRHAITGLRAGLTEPIVLRQPLAVRNYQTGGYRADSALARMRRNGHGRTITTHHLQAVERLQRDYQLGIVQASSPKAGTERVDGAQHTEREYGWLIAATRYRAAQTALGRPFWPMVYAVAIDGWDLDRLAGVIGVTAKAVVGAVITALDQLVTHYWPERDTRARLVERALAAATPFGFDFAVSAIGEAIPAERIGKSATRVAIAA